MKKLPSINDKNKFIFLTDDGEFIGEGDYFVPKNSKILCDGNLWEDLADFDTIVHENGVVNDKLYSLIIFKKYNNSKNILAGDLEQKTHYNIKCAIGSIIKDIDNWSVVFWLYTPDHKLMCLDKYFIKKTGE